ncbi:MAG TPA: recombination-associated protein RdgC [Myxococcota bacterium]|nr:recombination-associated protein RdgC [Myxococcota bacterium]
MGLLNGGVTARRFRVVGDLPDGWRDHLRERLEKNAFREPPNRVAKEEVEGWVRVQNLLDTDFDDFNLWLFQAFAVFSLRVDKKVLPGKLLSATVDKECRKWARDRGVERVPASMRKEIKERIEAEWLDRALPRVAVTELAWNVTEGWALVGTTSEKTIDRIRKRFSRSFGLDLVPWSPLDAVRSPDLREALLASAPEGGEA